MHAWRSAPASGAAFHRQTHPQHAGSTNATAQQVIVPWGRLDDGEGSVPRGLTHGIASVHAGERYTLLLLADGTVRGFGARSLSWSLDPLSRLWGVRALAAGQRHVLALLQPGGRVVGVGGDESRAAWTVPAAAARGVEAIAAGWDLSVAVKDRGRTLLAWGAGAAWPVPPRLKRAVAEVGVAAVAAGGPFYAVLLRNGSVATVIDPTKEENDRCVVPGAVPLTHASRPPQQQREHCLTLLRNTPSMAAPLRALTLWPNSPLAVAFAAQPRDRW